MLTIKASAVDATTARRAAIENNFIAALDDEGPSEWEWETGANSGGLFPEDGIYVTPVNLRGDNNKTPDTHRKLSPMSDGCADARAHPTWHRRPIAWNKFGLASVLQQDSSVVFLRALGIPP